MRVKLLDRANVVRYGGAIAEIPDHIASNLIKEGKAVSFVGNDFERKSIPAPPMNKMVWESPENKAFENTPVLKERYPGKGVSLFPEHIIER